MHATNLELIQENYTEIHSVGLLDRRAYLI